nr:hypothetical protein [uncultured Allomuricauda sp.]|tara:strand:- start:2486 stop:2707 length:222 start_codon:yes stop_codon:yes gene_type:complete
MAISQQLKDYIVSMYFNEYGPENIKEVESALKEDKWHQNEHENFDDDDFYNARLEELERMKDYLKWQEETASF